MRVGHLAGATALLVVLSSPNRAEAACSVNKIAELPVTMDQMGPMVDVKIEGTPQC